MNKEHIITECKKIRELFWNFYGLYYLWFKVGDGMEQCKYQRETFYPHRIAEKINLNFDVFTEMFFEETKKALEKSIRSEMRYVFNASYEDMKASRYHCDVTLGRFLKSMIPNGHLRFNRHETPIEWARAAFLWDGWSESYCGECWSKACDVFFDAKSIKSTKDKAFWIDKCLDLYHNNGFLLNKTPFATLSELNDLQERAETKSWGELINLNKMREHYVAVRGDTRRKTEIMFSQKDYPFEPFVERMLLKFDTKL